MGEQHKASVIYAGLHLTSDQEILLSLSGVRSTSFSSKYMEHLVWNTQPHWMLL